MNRRRMFSRRGNRTSLIITAAAAMIGFLPSIDALGVNTTFTNANNNGLWGDPGNWSNGVPAATDQAIFPLGPISTFVDLGGFVRPALTTRFNAAGYTLGNGTLNTQSVTASGATTIDAALTSPATSLTLQFSNTAIGALTVGGTIFGPIDLEAHAVLTGNNTYTGRTRVDSILNLSGAGTAANSSQFVVPHSKLQLDYTIPAGEVNKIGDAAPTTLWHSTLELNNVTGVQVNESAGTITLLKSANVIKLSTSDASAGTLNLTIPTIIRQDFASALIDVNPAQGTRLIPTASRGTGEANAGVQNVIYGWLMGVARPTASSAETPLSFITLSDSRGLRPLDLATEYNSSIDGSITDVRLTSSQTINSSTAAHSLVLHGAGVQLNGAQLTLSTGALALSADSSASGEILAMSGTGSLSTFASEMHVWTDAYAANAHRYRIDVPISAPNLTKSGPGTLVLSQANAINGSIYLNDGTLVAAAPGALGTSAVVAHAGAALRFEGASQNNTQLALDNAFVEGSRATHLATTLDVAPGITAGFDTVNGQGGLNKTGAGRLRIGSGTVQLANVFLLEGSIQVDGTFAVIPIGGELLPSIQANPNTTVLGNGTILANISAPLAPGVDGIGRLNVSTLGISAGNPALQIELNGTAPGTSYDQLVVLNAANLQFRALDVDLLNGFVPALGSQFTIIDDRFIGAITGAFNGLPQNAVFFADGQAFQINYAGGNGNDVVLTAVVPEPASALLGATVLALGLIQRRNQRTR